MMIQTYGKFPLLLRTLRRLPETQVTQIYNTCNGTISRFLSSGGQLSPGDPLFVEDLKVPQKENTVDPTPTIHVHHESSLSHDHEHDHDHNNEHVSDKEEEDDDMMEDMFVDPHSSFGHDKQEWGGPTRGGRYGEPTRFGVRFIILIIGM